MADQAPDSSGSSGPSTLPSSEGPDEAPSVQSPPRTTSSRGFDRPDADYLRRRAIKRSMWSAGITEPPPGSSSVSASSRRRSARSVTQRQEHTDHSMDDLLDSHGVRERATQPPDTPEFHHSSSSSTSAEAQGLDHQASPYGIGPTHQDSSSSLALRQHGSPFGSSPPAPPEGPDEWLLPRPFSHEAALPDTPFDEGPETRAGFYDPTFWFGTPPILSQNNSVASTPASLNRHSTASPTPLTIFERRRSMPLPLLSGPSPSLPPTRPLPPIPTSHPSRRPNSYIGPGSTDPSAMQWSGPQTQRQLHGELPARPLSYGPSSSVSGFSVTSRPVSGPPIGLSSIRPPPGFESERGYGPSVMGGTVPQTLTPTTSPFGREIGAARATYGSGIVQDVYGNISPAHQRDNQRRQNAPATRQGAQQPPRRNPRDDSSIVTPLGARLPRVPRRPVRRASIYLGEGSIGEWLNTTATEAPRVHGPGSGSDSEVDNTVPMDLDSLASATPAPVNPPPESTSAPQSGEEKDRVICALSESRSSDVIGVAVVNVTLGHVDLLRVVNDDRFRRLTETLWRMETPPHMFLVLQKPCSQYRRSALISSLKEGFPEAEVSHLDREHWNESEGLKLIDRFAWKKDIMALRQNLENNFYVSCAFSAVMSHLESKEDVVFRENSLCIKYSQPADTMGVDRAAVTSLELFQNIRHAQGKTSTVFGLLDNALTPHGRRMIRSALLQPSTSKPEIVARHEAVEELSSNEELFNGVRAGLKHLLHIDIERSLPWVLDTNKPRPPLQDGVVALIQGLHQIEMPSHEDLRNAEKDLTQILMLKAYLVGIQGLRETLEVADCTSQLCKWVMEQCGQANLAPVLNVLNASIEESAVYSKAPIDIRNNRLWAIKAEPNGVLEGARQMYRECTNDMHRYIEALNTTFQENLGTAPELRLASDNHYYLRFQWTDVERQLAGQPASTEGEEPSTNDHWKRCYLGGVATVNGKRRKHHYDCQTMELIQRSTQIQRHADIVTGQSDVFVVDLKHALLRHAELLLGLNEAIALLDMVWSFAHLATTQNYVRPIMSDTLILKDARHPLVEARKQGFVANDVYSGDVGARFQLVCGGNMSGKTTYIKKIALIQILAQIGSFVPATYAAVPICDRLFTRVSTEDKPECNMGTFGVEMAEMNMISRQVTKHSLVIVDELGRGTAPGEALAVALSTAERLIDAGCRAFFATHLADLGRVLNTARGRSVVIVHATGEARSDGGAAQIELPHTVAPGPLDGEDYGVDLSRRFLPGPVVTSAERLGKSLRDTVATKVTGPVTRALRQNKLMGAMPDLLKQGNGSTMDTPSLGSYLKKLQTEFTVRMHIGSRDESKDKKGKGKADENTKPTPAIAATPALAPDVDTAIEEDTGGWTRKGDKRERGLMNSIMDPAEKKRPLSMSALGEWVQKRIKPDTTAPSTELAPVRRSSLIQALRKSARTPTTRAATPSSITTGISESATGPSMAGIPAHETPSARGLVPVRRQRAMAISAGSSNDGNIIQGIGLGSTSQQPTPSGPEELAQQDTDMARLRREWYDEYGYTLGMPEEEDVAGPSNPRLSMRPCSAMLSFLPEIGEEEEEPKE